MSKCLTCRFATYDGMCLAKGKFTALDADACGDYRPTALQERKELHQRISELEQLVQDMAELLVRAYWPRIEYDEKASELVFERMPSLGIEVKR